jgi:hypothetical protein
MKTSDLVKAMVGLLALGKSDFEAIEPFRHDRLMATPQLRLKANCPSKEL